MEIVSITGLPFDAIELEVTETSVMTDVALAERTLGRLKAAGFRLAIDDFGMGHSSLNYLQLFPVDRLKIDQSFVLRLQNSSEAENIVRTIVTLAGELRLDVVAEGVSTPNVLAKLREIQCGYGQGSMFSPALASENLAALLLSSTNLECRV
jgi:EAL domain-containing protein (putative c-di-GMP-specific phosphodiesterase class I)